MSGLKRTHCWLGRNAKIQWKADWERLPTEHQRQRALRSGFLEDSVKAYAGAFSEDLNHYYSGLNALGLLTVETEGAGPQWIERFWPLRERLPERVLAESEELPHWLQEKPNYSNWQRNNLWNAPPRAATT